MKFYGLTEETASFIAVFDSEEVDTFSYHARIADWMVQTKEATPRSYHKQNLINAFRLAIRPKIHRVRVEKDLVRQGEDLHVGHDWENGDAFENILQDLINVNDIDFKQLPLE